MGGSSYSDDFYNDRVRTRAATGTPTFKHDDDVRTGKAVNALHDTLNVVGKIRVSRDSDAHPESTAIGVFFDVTGSMGSVPMVMQTKLPQLMGLLLRKGYIDHPQVLFGAIGDSYSDRVPLQVGQFESGLEMDDNLTNLYLEGNGGGQRHESYQNAMYFFAHRTYCDCFEKRGKKGYLFIIGDEKTYDRATRLELSDLLGVNVEADVPTSQIVKDCLEKWEIFFIMPAGTSYFNSPDIVGSWKELLGNERVILLEKPENVCETIGLTIGLCEGTATGDSMANDLKDVGANQTAIATTTRALKGLADSRALAKTGSVSGTLPASKGRSTATTRI